VVQRVQTLICVV